METNADTTKLIVIAVHLTCAFALYNFTHHLFFIDVVNNQVKVGATFLC